MGSLNAKKGDQFWTMLQKVSRSGSVLGTSPYSTRCIHLSRKNVENELRIELPPKPVRARTALDAVRVNHAAFVEVAEIHNGNVYARVVSKDQRPDQCPVNLDDQDDSKIYSKKDRDVKELFQSSREEPIKWEGTEQTISGDQGKTRKSIFSEDDVRGNKNNLLGGNQ